MGDVPGATTFHKPAEAYDRLVGRYSHELARAVIDAAGVRPVHVPWTSAAGRAR